MHGRRWTHAPISRIRDSEIKSNAAERLAATLTLAVLVAVLPLGLSASERLVTGGIILAMVPIGLLIDKKLPPQQADNVSIVVHGVVLVLISASLPSLWHACLLVIATLLTAGISFESTRAAMAQIVVFAAVMGAIGWIADIDQWWAPVAALLAVAPSIEHHRRYRRALQDETDRRYDTLVETAGMFFWEVDPSTGEVLSITGNTQRPLGRSADETVATNWFDLVDRDAFERALGDMNRGGGVCALDLLHRDGRWVPFRHRVVTNSDGIVQGAAMEIAELAHAKRVIRHQAEHDSLTGLITRTVFESRLSDALDQRRSDEPVAVMMVDLDRFKDVNDLLGHRVGDRLLVAIARRLGEMSCIDVAARMGGDEFALLLLGENARRAELAGMKVVDVIERLVGIDRMTLSVSASVGIAMAPDDGLTGELLMVRADTAMYKAKSSGHRMVRYCQIDDSLGERMRLGERVGSALDEGRFELWFQPKVDLGTGRVVGAEGLARWRHPELGVLTPDRFLPVLAMSGAYQRFTDDALEQGIAFASESRRQGAALGVAINLNAMSFLDHGLPGRIDAMLTEAQVPASDLTLEITESEILGDHAIHQPVFDALRRLGLTLSIDDFGVGYSSLSRLRELPVEELKIDRSFVAGMCHDPEDLVIVKSIVGLALVLGHTPVAEGVERAEEAEMLRDMGCVLAQGYYFGRPMPAAEFFKAFPARSGAPRIARVS